ncbi:glycosyl hydrolase family 8 [Roseomonas sp. KE0001]|uniref:glycosyl hydrolase family 8 n=1 Tax=Roseomonas sp. KE0001 TaxID=2479201 RepID=UPI0018E011FB|nr:glycosyl hydrolase family 8 [Roseomonas sp. KE0001]MBI0432665.1 glycosyl hydrolase family 5 [Roseomonas sp. KE0001]
MARGHGRRSILGATAAVLVSLPRQPGHAEHRNAAGPAPRDEWESFRARFVTGDGRVVDTGNGGISHSEGQGWGLLFAEAFDDQATFRRILAWTRRALARPQDRLHAWRWQPGRARPVEDANNATDGDIFIAWALSRAARRWQDPDLALLAGEMLRDLEALCIRQVDGRTLLLPAAFGFDHPRHVVVNPSYYVFPAFPGLARLRPAGPWKELTAEGCRLLRQARFGPWQLPADWIQIDRPHGAPRPAQGWAPRFSYDAVRVPLYLSWAGLTEEPALAAARLFWGGEASSRPAWTDLDGRAVAPYAADAGIQAVAEAVTATRRPGPRFPPLSEARSYYAASLLLLSRLAVAERPQLAL